MLGLRDMVPREQDRQPKRNGKIRGDTTVTNDLEISEQCHVVILVARKLNHLLANMPHTEMQLFMALSDIERAANKAENRLNDLMYGRSFKPPVEQMGQ